MTIEVFTGDKIDFKVHERRQYERIKREMIKKLNSTSSRYIIIVDYIIDQLQYDIIVITKDAIISIDLKGYKGNIEGNENGKWYVLKKNGKRTKINQKTNPFKQAKNQRFKLIDFLNKHLPQISKRFEDKDIYNISSVVCFEKGSYYDYEQINDKKHKWFHVTDETKLLDILESVSSEEFFLKDIEIDALLKQLQLNRIEIKTDKEKLDISSRNVLSHEDINRITERIVDDFGTIAFKLKDLSTVVDNEVAIRYIGEALNYGILERTDEPQSFILAENWSDNLPYVEDNEDIASSSDLDRYSQSDFWLRPKKSVEGEEYQGIYRGTKFHINYLGEIWWTAGREKKRLKASFTESEIADKILEIKPQGGSFRITEAGEILTKIFIENQGYISYYITNLTGDIEFEDLKWKPKNLRPGHLWPSVYDGAAFSVNSAGGLLIHLKGNKVYAKEGHEELTKKVLSFIGKYGGGRFKINENGNVLVLMYKAPYPDKIKKQYEELTVEEKNIINIREEKEVDSRVPIYVGKFKGNIKFKKIFDIHRPWTKEEDEDFLERLGC